MTSVRRILSRLFSWTFLGGVLSGIVVGAGGIYLFAQVYVRMAGRSTPAKDPYLGPAPVSVQDSLSSLGSVPPDWSLVPIEGGDSTTIGGLSDRPLLVTVGTAWCEPCTAQLSTLLALQDTLGAEARVMVVSPDEPDSLRHSLSEQKFSLSVYTTGDLPSPLQGALLPRSYVVRPGGKVVVRHVGPADWNTPPVRRLLSRLATSEPS